MAFNGNSDEILRRTPKLKIGTYWMMKTTQVSNSEGKASDYTANEYCEIDSIFKLDGRKVYRALYTIEEQNKKFHVVFDEMNFELLSINTITDEGDDTLAFQSNLLRFPLFEDRSWRSREAFQEAIDIAALSMDAEFHVDGVGDSTFTVNGQTIQTKAWKLSCSLEFQEQKFNSHYIYLAPTKKFPGSCPILMWIEMMHNIKEEGKTNQMHMKKELLEFGW
jgi:hypothetical protein